MNGDLGNDLIVGETGSDILNGGDGNDDIYAHSRVDWFNTNWDFRQSVTIESDNFGLNMTDFTVKIDGSKFGDDFWNNVKS